MKLLIAEDEHLIRKWLSNSLDFQELNINQIYLAEDGEEACKIIQTFQPDIVLTDINMPKMDAFELFEATKSIPYRKIILSGYDEFINAKKAMQYGVIDFLVKPIDLVELRKCFVTLLYDIHKKENKTASLEKQEFDILGEVRYSRDVVTTQVLEWIKEHYAEKFTTQDLATALNYSESYIYQKIKKHLEMSLNEYLNRYRVKMATNHLIKEPDLRLYEVANLVGFNDPKYFNQVFKKYMGITVTQFKEKML